MEKFIIKANSFLHQDALGYYHTLYKIMSDPTSQTRYINYLKNDNASFSNNLLEESSKTLYENLKEDLPEILREQKELLYVCVVPRAKVENLYKPSQLLFKKTICTFVENHISTLNICNGVDFIKRTKDTRTTHLSHSIFSGHSELPSPYIGISKGTCSFSPEIKGKNILLIDDLYTFTVNIDEDMIQALYDNGANNVIFYSIGYHIKK